jgi:hypothetical protein
MSSIEKRKVAILGGGQAALTAALQLSDPRNPASEDLELTIYQLGWRLGGKGATGRPAEGPSRILEHGLHNWFGFYENSFRQARAVHHALGGTDVEFDHAFTEAHSGAQVEWIEGQPLVWNITNPRRPGAPGTGGPSLSRAQAIGAGIELLASGFAETPMSVLNSAEDPVLAFAGALLRDAVPGLLDDEPLEASDLLRLAGELATAAATGAEHELAPDVDRIMHVLERKMPGEVRLPRWIRRLKRGMWRAATWLLWLFAHVVWRATRDEIQTIARTGPRRVWIMVNFAYACIAGAIRDDVIHDGFDVINDRDLRAWLGKHAYDDGGVMLHSPIVEAVYCGSFAYPRGDTSGPLPFPPAENMEAGTALRGLGRTLLTYRGAFAYRFAAGTADTCYAPAYRVLCARGVKVRFFSEVRHLGLEDGRIVRIEIAGQARVVGDAPYEPLVCVDGVPCWPVEPRWEQLVGEQGEPGSRPDYEWPGDRNNPSTPIRTLEVGSDFDDVVLGISIAALEPICAELVAEYGPWKRALRKVQTVRTQSTQLWLAETTQQLLFPFHTRKPVTNWRYENLSPLNVWGDYSELIDSEGWPDEGKPHSLAYFCSTMSDQPKDLADQAHANAQVHANALELMRGLAIILPGILDDGGRVRWDLLVDPTGETPPGPERLATQWIRANVTPTERYVLSVVGSSKWRLPVHDAKGPSNLYLAGDWTKCVLNCGCMEAATISGMLCANALSGYPKLEDIDGLNF